MSDFDHRSVTHAIAREAERTRLRAEVERLTAERDGLAKALAEVRDMTYYKVISDQTDASRLAHLVNQTARAALAALSTPEEANDAR